MKDKIILLIQRDDLKGAAALLQGHDSVHQSGRIYQLERDVRMGVITHEQATRTRNQIRHAILNSADISEQDLSNAITPVRVAQPRTEAPEVVLKTIILQNKRRREDIANQARDILSRLQAYQNEKDLSAAFDPSGRRYKAIMEDFNSLSDMLNEAKGDDIEAIVGRIKSLISETIPTYDQLDEAYRLASGRGMKSEYIDRTLNNRPSDNDARISIAELIEEFIENINVL